MRRREFITFLSGATAWPLAARAQQAAMPVIGFLRNTSPDDSARLVAAFHQGLNETGFVEHRNVGIEYRWAQNRIDRLAELASDLVGRQVVAILASGDTSALAAKSATSMIPIVFATGIDPIQIGVVTSLNRPGGNITGIYWLGGPVLEAKRMELLRELTPKAATIAYFRNPNSPSGELAWKEVSAAAQALGQQIVVMNVRGERDLDAVFAKLVQQRVEALLVAADALFFSTREQIISMAERYRVPAMYQWRAATEAGGLASYGPSITDAHRQGGNYVGRILKGEKPADLPVVQSTRFEFVINLKAAKTLGLDVPPSFYWRADEVIE